MTRTETMKTAMPLIQKMPFFEGFHSKGKAIIDTDAFEKWIREVSDSNLQYKQDKKQTVTSGENITEVLNRIYETESSAVDPVLMKMQAISAEREEW